MSQKLIPELPDYGSLKGQLSDLRQKVIKDNNFTSEDESYIRTTEDAAFILDFVEQFQSRLYNFFKTYPSLMSLFNSEYVSFSHFISETTISEIIFLDDCLFPEKESFFFGQDGGINPVVIKTHLSSLEKWIEEKKGNHNSTLKSFKEGISIDLSPQELACQCTQCIAEYRSKIRDQIYFSCISIVENSEKELRDNIGRGISEVSQLYKKMLKEVEKNIFKVRYRLKKSSLNRLDAQIRQKIKNTFEDPSPLALSYVSTLEDYLKEVLLMEGAPEDLIGESEREKLFNQLSSNIWKSEKFLRREFRKFIKSILILKKKDVSSKILIEYLGSFWLHTQAREIKRKIIYHMGPTNSGKTYHAIEALCAAEKGCYLAPLRLLAGELYDKMNSKGTVTSLLTGEEVVEVEGATHYSSTIEMAKLQQNFDCVVIDEIQMITDPQRGWAWTRALINMFSPEIHICGDASVLELIEKIVAICGDELIIKKYDRMTELKVEKSPLQLNNLKKSDALIVFSRRNALKHKYILEKKGFKVSIVYGRLSPEVRREQARKFDSGETDIIVSTDAISMGMNLPIKRIVFSTLSKFINSQEFVISDSEIKQIAGRAGRYQRFPVGFVNCLDSVDDGLGTIRDALECTLGQKEKCMVGPDLEIFNQVNTALDSNSLPRLKLSEFLRLFYTMSFEKPFYCVELKEMIELAEMVEEVDGDSSLTMAEIFGFACAPVNLGMMEHVQFYMWILNQYVKGSTIYYEPIDATSNDIEYLETSIKCIELFQWISRHFNNKYFDFDDVKLHDNKSQAVEKLNQVLSSKMVGGNDLFRGGRRRNFSGRRDDRSGGDRRGRRSEGDKDKGKPKRRFKRKRNFKKK
jgi:ATP-dependent RNA helicase SUPV3L1/SUV3